MAKECKTNTDIAVLSERMENHFKTEEVVYKEMRSDIKEIKRILESERENISTTKNRLENHLSWHQDAKSNQDISLKKVSILVTVISIVVGALIQLITKFITR